MCLALISKTTVILYIHLKNYGGKPYIVESTNLKGTAQCMFIYYCVREAIPQIEK